MTSRTAKGLSVLIALALGYWLSSSLFQKTEPLPNPPEVATPRPIAAAPPPAQKPPPATAPVRAAPVRPAAEGRNLIPFRVVKGKAIAYGDILLGTPEDSSVDHGYYDAPTPLLWDRPEIPYAISDQLPEPERVEEAIRYFHRHTPVRFVPYQGEADAIVFEPGDEHCYSLLGRVGGAQPIQLSPNCTWHEIAHEILHTLGFIHEHSRTDRDQYVQVLWDNVKEEFRDQFEKVPESFMTAVRGTLFDYRSIMLYSGHLFVREKGLISLQSLSPVPIQPVELGLSPGDIERLKRLYP